MIYKLIITLLLTSVLFASVEEGELKNKMDVGSINIGYTYKMLTATYIPNSYVETTGMNVAKVSYDPSVGLLSNLSYLGLFLGYETNFNKTQSDTYVERTEEKSNAWEKYFANISIDFMALFGVYSNEKHTFVTKYDKQSFTTTVQSKADYWYLSTVNSDLLLPGDLINVSTVFQDFQYGYHYIPSKNKKDLSGEMGIGYFNMTYNKPFATNLDTTVTTIYNATFKASGLYMFLAFRNIDFYNTKFNFEANWNYSPSARITLGNGVDLGSIDSDSPLLYDNYIYRAISGRIDMNYNFYIPMGLSFTYEHRSFDRENGSNADLPTDEIIGLELNLILDL